MARFKGMKSEEIEVLFAKSNLFKLRSIKFKNDGKIELQFEKVQYEAAITEHIIDKFKGVGYHATNFSVDTGYKITTVTFELVAIGDAPKPKSQPVKKPTTPNTEYNEGDCVVITKKCPHANSKGIVMGINPQGYYRVVLMNKDRADTFSFLASEMQKSDFTKDHMAIIIGAMPRWSKIAYEKGQRNE